MSERKIVYTYHPREGEFVTGVPARDLTQADVDRAGSDFMRIAEGSGMYRPAKETAKDRKEREEREAAIEAERLAAATAALDNAPSDADGGDDSGDAGEGNGE